MTSNQLSRQRRWQIKKKALPLPPIFEHNICGGLVSFDSFGNFKCRKCGVVTHDKDELNIRNELQVL